MRSVLTGTSAALLGVLYKGPQTGAQLLDSLDDLRRSVFHVSSTRVYLELPRLAEVGSVRHGRQRPDRSQEYLITPAGKAQFKRWLTTGPTISHFRSEQLLRLIYADYLTPAQRTALFNHARNTYIDERNRARLTAAKTKNALEKAIARFRIAEVKASLALIDALERA